MKHFTPPFWLVWCEDGGAPTVKHEDFARARSEAQRLARLNPGKHFVVMAAAIGFAKRDLDETRFAFISEAADLAADDQDIPF